MPSESEVGGERKRRKKGEARTAGEEKIQVATSSTLPDASTVSAVSAHSSEEDDFTKTLEEK